MTRVKPTALKKIEGTFRKDRAPKNEIQPTIALNSGAPAELNEWGAAIWNDIYGEYERIGLITKVDLSALTALCIEWGKYQEANDIIAAQGMQIEEPIYSQKGELVGSKTVVNPLLKVASDSLKNYVRLCGEFGITPASRARVSAPDRKPNDNFAEFD